MTTLRFLTHQEFFDKALGHLFRHGDTGLQRREDHSCRGFCEGYLFRIFIAPFDYITGVEGIPVIFLGASALVVPDHMCADKVALKRALLRSQINVYDPTTIELLSYLQSVCDFVDKREWRDGLASGARQFSLRADLLEQPA